MPGRMWEVQGIFQVLQASRSRRCLITPFIRGSHSYRGATLSREIREWGKKSWKEKKPFRLGPQRRTTAPREERNLLSHNPRGWGKSNQSGDPNFTCYFKRALVARARGEEGVQVEKPSAWAGERGEKVLYIDLRRLTCSDLIRKGEFRPKKKRKRKRKGPGAKGLLCIALAPRSSISWGVYVKVLKEEKTPLTKRPHLLSSVTTSTKGEVSESRCEEEIGGEPTTQNVASLTTIFQLMPYLTRKKTEARQIIASESRVQV